MATSIVRQQRRRTRTVATVEDPVRQLFEHRAGMIARQEFVPLGKIIQIHTAAGVLDFRAKGPAIGRLGDGSLDLVDLWPGVPPRYDVTQELCPACLDKCDECKRGKRKCNQGRHSCGGSGKVKTGEKPCACVKRRKRANPNCKKCNGYGALPVMSACKTCDGTGKVKCPLCRGTGKMSTGRKDGSTDRHAASCADCQGYGRKLEAVDQDLAKHLSDSGEYKVLGPIRGLLVLPFLEQQRIPQWWSASYDAQGKPLTLVFRKVQPGAQAVMLGGTLVAQNISGQA
ncbi:MAG TPA: hypothetical protein VJN64_11760 [Terriglobales bacterium]|nr:hypothetical protein [Terriglobales bacterium]